MAGKISGNKLVKNRNELSNPVMPGHFRIQLSLLTRRSLEDQPTRSRRRQAQSTSVRSRRKRITLPRVSILVDKPET